MSASKNVREPERPFQERKPTRNASEPDGLQGRRAVRTGSGQACVPRTVLIRCGSPQTISSTPGTGHRRGQCLRGDLVRTAVDGDDHDGPAGGTLGAGVRVEHVVRGVVLGPVGRLTEGQFMGGPRVRFTGGQHQDVARRTPGVQQQVDGLVGGVDGAVGGCRDQLELRSRGSAGLAGGRLRGAGALRRRSGDRPTRRGSRSGLARTDTGRGSATRRRGAGTGTRNRTGGRRGTAGGRSCAGTRDTLVNLRLLGEERHKGMSIKRKCGTCHRVPN